MKRVIPLLVLLAIGGAVVYFHPQWFRKPAVENVLKLSGNIEAHESLVSFKVTGRIIALPVEEGMTLKSGDLLARLDSDDYRQQVAEDESAIAVRDRQLALGLAGSRTQDIESAKLAALDAQADLEQKKKDYARYQALYEKDEIPGQTRDLAATNVTRAQATYDRAQQIYNELVEGTRKEELAVEHSNVHQADQNLRMSRIRLTYTVLRAPFNGVVLVRQAELGEVVSPGTPVVTLADLDHLWVRVYVPETDLGKVHWGQVVDVRTDTYP
ncbi:MAG: efflux RND transporter periplasmic adaptor subunit, partial [Terriglobia bacterium]